MTDRPRLSAILLGVVPDSALQSLRESFELSVIESGLDSALPLATDGRQLNRLIDDAKSDWLLVLREREKVSAALANEIAEAVASERAWGYRLVAENYYCGSRLGGPNSAGEIRLFHRRRARFVADPGAREMHVQGTVVRLRHPLQHELFSTRQEHESVLSARAIPRTWAAHLGHYALALLSTRAMFSPALRRFLWIESGFVVAHEKFTPPLDEIAYNSMAVIVEFYPPVSKKIDVCTRPVFVIGCPRSGTSVAAWSLAAIETEFWTFPETDFFFYLFADDPAARAWQEIHRRSDHRSWLVENAVTQSEFDEFVALGVNALITSRNPRLRWIDSTPTYTLIADTLARLIPASSFVNVLRDGRRVIHSMLNFMRGKSEDFRQQFSDLTFTADFAEACRTWALYVAQGAAVGSRYSDRCVTLINEEMSSDPDRAFARVLDTLGTSPSDLPASFSRTERINSSFETAQSVPPWELWGEENRQIFREATRTALDGYPDDVRARVQRLWPDFDAWYGATPSDEEVSA